MPSIKDKLIAEERNDRTVRLWPEGYAFVAYERSAYLFVSQVKRYEVIRRYIEVAGQDVVSIKFPKSVIEKQGLSAKNETDGSVTFKTATALDEQQYLLWRDALPMATAVKKNVRTVMKPEQPAVPVRENPDEEDEVVSRLRAFNLATATPLDCMMLVSELQKMLREKDR